MGRKRQQELCLILAPRVCNRVGIEVIRPWFQPVVQQMLSREGRPRPVAWESALSRTSHSPPTALTVPPDLLLAWRVPSRELTVAGCWAGLLGPSRPCLLSGL